MGWLGCVCLWYDEDRAFVCLWNDEHRLLFYAVGDSWGDDAVWLMLFSSCFDGRR
jgi:hypothetical protein